MEKEIAVLEKRRKTKESQGHIRVSKDKGRYRYYLVTPKSGVSGKFLKKKDREVAERLIQRKYEESMLASLYEEQEILLKLHARYQKEKEHFIYGPEERIWSGLAEGRKQLARPVIPDDELYVREWLAEEYERKPFAPDAPEFYTDSGIRVRSKTELIITEMLEKKGIPFYYEKPLVLKGSGRIHPDFTVLNVKKRKTMYWEHLGKMDDIDYLDHALGRIGNYEAAGLFPGKDLILTYESSSRQISTKMIEKTIMTYLL